MVSVATCLNGCRCQAKHPLSEAGAYFVIRTAVRALTLPSKSNCSEYRPGFKLFGNFHRKVFVPAPAWTALVADFFPRSWAVSGAAFVTPN